MPIKYLHFFPDRHLIYSFLCDNRRRHNSCPSEVLNPLRTVIFPVWGEKMNI